MKYVYIGALTLEELVEKMNEMTGEPVGGPVRTVNGVGIIFNQKKIVKKKKIDSSEAPPELLAFKEDRNSYTKIGSYKGLPICKGVTNVLIDSWNKLWDRIEDKKLIIIGLNNYIEDINSRSRLPDSDTYKSHRFSLFEFISKKNGIYKFMN